MKLTFTLRPDETAAPLLGQQNVIIEGRLEVERKTYHYKRMLPRLPCAEELEHLKCRIARELAMEALSPKDLEVVYEG